MKHIELFHPREKPSRTSKGTRPSTGYAAIAKDLGTWDEPSAWRRIGSVVADEYPILRRHWGGIEQELAAHQRHQRHQQPVEHQTERAALTRLAPAPSAPSPAPSAITMIIN